MIDLQGPRQVSPSGGNGARVVDGISEGTETMHRALARIMCGVALAACTTPTSATDLHPEGPPMIEQVRLAETYVIAGVRSDRVVFGFGSHVLATASDEHAVTTALA